jgi:hypothetical protein
MALILVLSVWAVYWSYRACWLAAKRNETKWFLFFLIVNLLGIPEIIDIRKGNKELL